MSETIQETQTQPLSYKTFNDFVKEYFIREGIEIDDLNNSNDEEFKTKYNITKNDLHAKCVELYKTELPQDYELFIQDYRVKQAEAKKVRQEQYEAYVKQQKQKILEIVLRQTDYTEEQAIQHLEEENYNFEVVLKKYMNPEYKKQQENTIERTENLSVNQKIYKEIRDFMDHGSMLYQKRKEYSEKVIENERNATNNTNDNTNDNEN